jgi:glycosyltransferase involved in cell wall biosynthesis
MDVTCSVSIIIPVYNGASTLGRCLDAVLKSALAPDECIVVDDRSTDDSADIARRYGVRVIQAEGHGGPARARNLGASAARSEILLFIDADVSVHPDTISKVVEAFKSAPVVDAVIGSYDFEPACPNFLSQYKNLFHTWVHQNSRRDAVTFWTGCGAIRRSLFQACGGFNENWRRPSVEDIEFGALIRRAGGRILLDRDVQVQHLKHWSFISLLRTDIFDRGIPWTVLALGQGGMPDDLNLKMDQRVSVLLVYLAVLFAFKSILLASVTVLAALALNLPLYRFLAGRRGWLFSLRALPLHLLYFFYCGVAFGAGALFYAAQSVRGASPAPKSEVTADAQSETVASRP